MYEAIGLADHGQGAAVCKDGLTEIDGKLPVNTGGGARINTRNLTNGHRWAIVVRAPCRCNWGQTSARNLQTNEGRMWGVSDEAGSRDRPYHEYGRRRQDHC